MIHSLEYDVQFTKTGRSLTRSLRFEKGVTAIVGSNESGKSFAVEMLRFALFGSAALRGTSEDYASLICQATFVVKDKHLLVSRTLNKATLTEQGQPIAVGTKPVNTKILEILGFNLEIFDIVCSVNQGQVEQLANMKPTERKQMIDRVIGADRLEKLGQWCGEQGLLARRELDTLKRTLVEPTEPEMPEGYSITADELAVQIVTLEGFRPELAELQVLLQHAPPTLPAPDCPSERSLSDLEDDLAAITSRRSEWDRISAIPVLDFDPQELEAEWEAYHLGTEANRFYSDNRRPTLSPDEIEGLSSLHVAQVNLRQLQARKVQLQKSPTAVCPCGKEFSLEQHALEEVDRQIAELGNIDLALRVDMTLLEQEKERNENWVRPETLALDEKYKDVDRAALRPLRAVQGVSHMIGAEEKERQLAALSGPRDPDPLRLLIQRVRTYHSQLHAFEENQKLVQAFEALRPQREQRFAELNTLLEDLALKTQQHRQALLYEQQVANWEQARVLYEQRLAEIEKIEGEQAGWQGARGALGALRLEIKGHLAPALSAVASMLLSRMTSGQRNSIVVNEEFEITVDNQPIGTLSGSGKACANIALRLGLAQVLTNNVLSLFIGDEIDASMDEERSGNLQEVILQLENTVSQILLVTHKTVSVTNVIEMGHERENKQGRL